jgi:hypothetical protein
MKLWKFGWAVDDERDDDMREAIELSMVVKFETILGLYEVYIRSFVE